MIFLSARSILPVLLTLSVPVSCRTPPRFNTELGPMAREPELAKAPRAVNDRPAVIVKLPWLFASVLIFRKDDEEPLRETAAALPMVVRFGEPIVRVAALNTSHVPAVSVLVVASAIVPLICRVPWSTSTVPVLLNVVVNWIDPLTGLSNIPALLNAAVAHAGAMPPTWIVNVPPDLLLNVP